VQVSHAVRERLGDRFEFESRGLVDVKGKGPTPAYFLVAHSTATASRTVGKGVAGSADVGGVRA
jgi:hypothetical protein